ncbi:MAG: hypothetical protein A2138_10985 [Deltaproteobacteria bacterium RBG_16_71_12]|nr:MAG: hypothetical protein A2138_10985 [Deltaproteobacteria bacterium RBG_16_71_12]
MTNGATGPLPDLEPALDDENAPLPEGEVVALPLPSGARTMLRFPSPFELVLTLAGRRVTADDAPASRDLLLWSWRRLPALWRALGERTVLLAAHADGAVVVTDLVELEPDPRAEGDAPAARAVFLDHGALRERLEPCNAQLAQFSLLGAVGTKAELERRVRGSWAPGTQVEVRVEDEGRIVSRRRLRVGR